MICEDALNPMKVRPQTEFLTEKDTMHPGKGLQSQQPFIAFPLFAVRVGVVDRVVLSIPLMV